MMPISLTLSAFGPYPDTITIDFESFQEDGLFLITGPTGSGKTMIFDAMIFALYGKTSGQIRQTDSLRCDHALNEISTFVEFSFSLHQQNYTIKRNPKYYLEGKKTPKQPSALLTLPDGKMVEGIKEVNQKMISLLGVDDQQFKQICMIAQGEFTKLIMASSDEREKVLRELFHSETYQKLEEKLKVHLKVYQDKYDLLLNKRKDLMQELQVEDHQEYLSKQTKLIASQQKEYDDLKKDLDQKKQQLQLYRLQNQRLIQLKDLKQQFQDLKKQENDYQELNKTIDTLKKAQETNYLYISYIKQQKKLQTLNLNQEDFLKQLKKLEKDYQEKKVQANSLDYKQQTKEKLQNQMGEIRRNEREKRKMEKKLLQSQINPHFLYNTLDSIIWMIQSGEYKGAEQMVSSLAKFFRISLSQGKDIIPLEKELEHATSYLAIQNIRFKDKFEFSVQADKKLLHYLCPKLSIQPLLENAIYHGMEGVYDDGEITISVYEKDNLIHIDVSDNGLGMPEKVVEYIMHNRVVSSKRGSGIGVRNVDERIKLIYGEQYGVTIESELDEGTTATIIIPKLEETDEK